MTAPPPALCRWWWGTSSSFQGPERHWTWGTPLHFAEGPRALSAVGGIPTAPGPLLPCLFMNAALRLGVITCFSRSHLGSHCSTYWLALGTQHWWQACGVQGGRAGPGGVTEPGLGWQTWKHTPGPPHPWDCQRIGPGCMGHHSQQCGHSETDLIFLQGQRTGLGAEGEEADSNLGRVTYLLG